MGGGNAFFGSSAGQANQSGNDNTVIGHAANVGSASLTHATAIGAHTVVAASNRVQIGRVGVDSVAIGAFSTVATNRPVCIDGNGVFSPCNGLGISTPLCIIGNVFNNCFPGQPSMDNLQLFSQRLQLVQDAVKEQQKQIEALGKQNQLQQNQIGQQRKLIERLTQDRLVSNSTTDVRQQ